MEHFKNGIIKDNPVFGLFLGLCSALAVSTSLNNALGMGLCVTLVLLFSNIIISAIRNIVPHELRIPVYIVIIATLVTIVEMLVHAYMPALYDALGVFLSLIVVNCIILGRAEAFASQNGIKESILDALGMGLGYTLALLSISLVREFLATAAITFYDPFNAERILFQLKIAFLEPYKISLFATSVGAFLTFACFAAGFAAFQKKKGGK